MKESAAEQVERLEFENECKEFFVRVTGLTVRSLDLPRSTVSYRLLDVQAGIAANKRIIQHMRTS